jgi:hypothetical protein
MKNGSSHGSKSGAFLLGLIAGILCSAIAVVLIIRYTIRNPQAIMTKAQDLGMNQVIEKAVEMSVEKTVTSIPQDLVTVRQDEINQTMQNLTAAYSENRLTPMDIQLIAGKFYGVMSDNKVTPQEIDDIMDYANKMSK